jgi:CRP-like cAMP-binding protein
MQEHMLTQYRTALLHFIQDHEHLREKYALDTVEHPPHQKLLQQAAAPHSVFILTVGLVKVVRTTSLGQAFTLGVFERGELLGDVEAIMDMPYFGTVETVTRCRLWKMAPEQFLKMLSQEPEFNLLILKATISKMLNTSHKAAIQNTNKLYYSLLIVLREFSRLNDLQITKQLLAEALGTSVRNLNRLLGQLEEKMIIKIKYSLIREINLEGLDQQIHTYENTIQ